jgi:hypothetical protein
MWIVRAGDIVLPTFISGVVLEYSGIISGEPDISFTIFQYTEN